MTPKTKSHSNSTKPAKPLIPAAKTPAKAQKRGVVAAQRESLTEQGLPHIPGEDGTELPPRLDDMKPSGPMSKATVQQTESTVNHPMGKTRSGVAQGRRR